MKNKLSLTLISFLANFIMAGFASQFGMLIEPIAQSFNADVNSVAFIFSLLNGGALIGTILAFFLIDIIGIKRITLLSYSIIIACSLILYITNSLLILQVCMTLIGLCGGIGLCIAGTIVVSTWQDKIQSTMLVVQDATFNIAGVIFPLITTYALTHDLSWASSYLMVGLVTVLMLFIIILTNFDLISHPTVKQSQPSEWNFGILSAGIGLFLAMLALYTFLTWAPLFVSQKFSISFELAGNIITQYWAAALIGALVSTVIVTRVKIEHFFISIILLAFIMTLMIVNTEYSDNDSLDRIGYLTYGYGFVCSALYNAFVAYGVTFVKNASSKNVSFILISGSAGAMFSPAISSILHNYLDIQVIMNTIPIYYAVIIVMLAISMFLKKRALKK
ncbi:MULTISPECIES: MFS transporter TsgA [unclassified Gilliamella]|uniref:MFS transporter TsgA n=1 Tax=unclassified Gilliamella TaxID=2685620 RepID=UPI00226A455B|nr:MULTISPECIES: MFS transporter TsgA [unclassified Gilliamella]MCX8582994.1 MFS transporter TsgA [Gilliamella sp. B3372]MCX8585988.1 MFS transporter TsgA [Gilliamella sp. B3562]MCX8595626.1 MFS transporter TsgA [Gilliamella sp. B3367]MCX8661464.1 MFS transporter TsgA [Gilliamella sp. B2772]MCX8663205.1 MFS transporter TsgA [Gilliamella sp. B2911]